MVKTVKVTATAEELTRDFYKNILTSPETDKSTPSMALLERANKEGVKLPPEVVLSLLSFMDLAGERVVETSGQAAVARCREILLQTQEIALEYLTQHPDCIKLLSDPGYPPAPEKIKLTYLPSVDDLAPYYHEALGEKIYGEYVDYLAEPLAQKSKDWLAQYKRGEDFLEPLKSLFDYLAGVYYEELTSSTPAVQSEVQKYEANWFATTNLAECDRLHKLLYERPSPSGTSTDRSGSPSLNEVEAEPVFEGKSTDSSVLNIAKQRIGRALLTQDTRSSEEDQTAQDVIVGLMSTKLKALKLSLGQGQGDNFAYAEQHIDLFLLRLFDQMESTPNLSTVFDSREGLVDSALSNAGVACGILSNPVLRKELFALLQQNSQPQSNRGIIDLGSNYHPKTFFSTLIDRALAADKHKPIYDEHGKPRSGERFTEIVDLLLTYAPKKSKEFGDALKAALLLRSEKESPVAFEGYLDKAFPGKTQFSAVAARVFIQHSDFFVLFLAVAKQPWPYLEKLFLASKSPLRLLGKCVEAAAKGNTKQSQKLNQLLSEQSIEILFHVHNRLKRDEIGQTEFDMLFNSLKPFILSRLESWKSEKKQSERDAMAGQIRHLFEHSEFITRLGISEDLLLSLNDASQVDAIKQALTPYPADDVCKRIEAIEKAAAATLSSETILPTTPGPAPYRGALLQELKDSVALSAVIRSWKQVDPFQRYWIKALLHKATIWFGERQLYKGFFAQEIARLESFSEHFRTKFLAEKGGRQYVAPALVPPLVPARRERAVVWISSPRTPAVGLSRRPTMDDNYFGLTPPVAPYTPPVATAGRVSPRITEIGSSSSVPYAAGSAGRLNVCFAATPPIPADVFLGKPASLSAKSRGLAQPNCSLNFHGDSSTTMFFAQTPLLPSSLRVQNEHPQQFVPVEERHVVPAALVF